MKPHSSFNYVRPDEVAECWDGVTPTLYQSLWDCVESYSGPAPEVSEEPVDGLH